MYKEACCPVSDRKLAPDLTEAEVSAHFKAAPHQSTIINSF